MNHKTVKRYKLETVTQCGVEYALCPTCRQGYKLIEDALKCCSESEDEDFEKERAVKKSSRLLLKDKIAIVSAFKYSAEEWRLEKGLKKDNCLWVTEDTVDQVDDTYAIVFVGKRKNYINLPVLDHPRIWRELQRQESNREFSFFALYEDENGVKALFPLDHPDEIKDLEKLIPKKGYKFTLSLLHQNDYLGRVAYTLKNIPHNLQQ